MVVVTLLHNSLSSLQTLSNPHHHIYTLICKKPTTPNCRASSSNPNRVLTIRAYMEESSSFSGFANKVIGALPVIGLVARIFSDVGGVGGDIIDFAEFRRRVGNNSSVNDSRAFYEFQERRGKVHVLWYKTQVSLPLLSFQFYIFLLFYCCLICLD